MKKLSVQVPTPSEPMPEVYRAMVDEAKPKPKPQLAEVHLQEHSGAADVPVASIYGHNLRKIKKYKKIRRNRKISVQTQVFINDISAILQEFPVGDNTYNDELLTEVLSIAESYFIYGSKQEREEAKSKAVRELMLPYYHDDTFLFEKMVGHVWSGVVKSTWLKRAWKRLGFFLKKIVDSS
jgi:hypothetical protein